MAEKKVAKTIVLYHYTNQSGGKAILKAGYIEISRQRPGVDDAMYGDGVYLTSLKPEVGKTLIALNNYNNTRTEKVDWYVEVELKEVDVEKVRSDRDIYIYRKKLELPGKEHWFGRVDGKI